MTPFEKWSLALTAIGYLFVASSILYAARQWLVAEKSLKRDIIKDTRAHISDIRRRINHHQTEIIERDIDPERVDIRSPEFVPVRLLLNTIEEVAGDLQSDFYDKDMLKKFTLPLAVSIWRFWDPVVMKTRRELNSPTAWSSIELVAKKYADTV